MDGSSPSGGLQFGAEIPSVPSAADIEVEPEKLADVADMISAQADSLAERTRGLVEALRIELPSNDLVSRHAIPGWNTRVVDGADSYYGRVVGYVNQLHSLAEQLHAAAAEYEAGEQEKAAAITRAGTGR